MRSNLSWLSWGHRRLIRLYPSDYRKRFAEEMNSVFTEALIDASEQGAGAILNLCLREARDLPKMLFSEYWQLAHRWYRARQIEGLQADGDLPGLVPPGLSALSDKLFFIRGCHPHARRLCDLIVALVGLLILAPLLVLLPILIKLDSRGPVFFRQARLRKDGRLYTMYKFRSMAATPVSLADYVLGNSIDNNLSVTRIGRLVRQHNLDEAPQLFNVLKGEMSIFGPRPLPPNG